MILPYCCCMKGKSTDSSRHYILPGTTTVSIWYHPTLIVDRHSVSHFEYQLSQSLGSEKDWKCGNQHHTNLGILGGWVIVLQIFRMQRRRFFKSIAIYQFKALHLWFTGFFSQQRQRILNIPIENMMIWALMVQQVKGRIHHSRCKLVDAWCISWRGSYCEKRNMLMKMEASFLSISSSRNGKRRNEYGITGSTKVWFSNPDMQGWYYEQLFWRRNMRYYRNWRRRRSKHAYNYSIATYGKVYDRNRSTNDGNVRSERAGSNLSSSEIDSFYLFLTLQPLNYDSCWGMTTCIRHLVIAPLSRIKTRQPSAPHLSMCEHKLDIAQDTAWL